MARLIDADKRIADIKKLYCDGCDNYGCVKCRACWVDDAMCLIDDAATVDAVEVVRCRECKYHNKPPCPMRLSFNWTEDNDFCSYGERKDGDEHGG